MNRIAIVCLIVMLTATSAMAAWPIVFVSMERICEGGANQLAVTVQNWADPDPGPDMGFTVTRRTTAPGLADPLLLTPELMPLPPYGETVTHLLPDPGLPAAGIGYYEGFFHDGGFDYLDLEAESSCVEHPYLMRGYLVNEDVVNPCNDIGLLECTDVLINDVDLLQYVGSNEMLDFYGWPIWLDGVGDCAVTITHIVPLGDDATCQDPVVTESHSWSAVKSIFR